MNLHDAPPGTIRTFSGRFVDPFNPNPDDLLIEDIAHALANINRWNGHTAHPYSVAEHSIAVALRLPPELRLAGLLHDAAEAYIGDIPTPIKKRLYYEADGHATPPDFAQAETLLLASIYVKFGVKVQSGIWNKEVHEADRAQLLHEWETLVIRGERPATKPVIRMAPKAAFLHYFDWFGGRR